MGDGVIIAKGGSSTLTLDAVALVFRRSHKVDEVQLSEVQSLRFGSGIGTGLVIESGAKEHVIPSGIFATELRDIDDRIRDAMAHDRSPDPFAKVPVIRRWVAGTSTRWIALVIGLLLLAVPPLVWLLGGPKEVMGILPFSVVSARALFAAAIRYRGSVTLDKRGLFVVRGTSTSFVAWSELDIARTSLDEGFVTKSFEVQTMKHGRPAKLAVKRLLWIGFPVVEIYDAIEQAVGKYR